MNAELVVKIENLHKQFDFATVLKGVSLDIHAGSIVGLVGANGAGKSTLIDWMTVGQIVRYVATCYPSWNTEIESGYLSEFKLDRDAIVGNLSPGQRQVLAILLAIGHEPDLLLLDEPAAALDPLARKNFFDLLLGMIQDLNRTILISSHILTDVEKVIDQIIILDQGEVRRDVNLDELQQEFVKLRITAVRGELPDPLPFEDLLACQRNGSEAIVVVRACRDQELDQVAERMESTIDVLPLSLEELYGFVLSATGEEPGS